MDYSNILSQKIQEIQFSGIRKFFDIAAEMENVISLGVGEPDFKTPWAIREAGIRSLENGKTWYTSNAGLAELKKEIAVYLKRRYDLSYDDKKEVLVTVGGSEGIDACIRSFVNQGDEVIVPEPSFVAYAPMAELAGAKVVHVATKQENQFKLTAEELKAAITPKTKMLIFPFPNNPTGAIMTKEELEPIAEVLRGTDIIVLSDEIYCELTYGSKHVSIASLPDMWERTVVINGFSKSYAMTGWRLGYACGPEPIITQMLKVHQYAIMCAPTTSQYAAIEALKSCDDAVVKMRDEYDLRRRLLVHGLNEMGLTCFEPKGAFYVFPSIRSTKLSSEEFCEKLLLSHKVAVVPGTAFGKSGEGHVRISYSYSIQHLMTALDKIKDFLEELK